MEARSRPEPGGGAGGARRVSLLLVAAAVLVAGCRGEPPDVPRAGVEGAQPTAAALLWRELGAWSGRGERQTESFEIASGALRLTWSLRSPDGPSAGTLRVSLHSAISGRPLETIVEHHGEGTDTVRLSAGPRVAYLLIESSGGAWDVGLQEGVAAGRR